MWSVKDLGSSSWVLSHTFYRLLSQIMSKVYILVTVQRGERPPCYSWVGVKEEYDKKYNLSFNTSSGDDNGHFVYVSP